MAEVTGRSEVFQLALWFAVVALVTAIWGANTLTNDDEMPHPPRTRREIADERAACADDESAFTLRAPMKPNESVVVERARTGGTSPHWWNESALVE